MLNWEQTRRGESGMTGRRAESLSDAALSGRAQSSTFRRITMPSTSRRVPDRYSITLENTDQEDTGIRDGREA